MLKSGICAVMRKLIEVVKVVQIQNSVTNNHSKCQAANKYVELLTGISTLSLPDDKVQWFLRQLKNDGSYSTWETVGTGNVCEILPINTGIFQVKAVIEGTAYQYKRKTDDPHSSLKTGSPNAFGVYVAVWQKRYWAQLSILTQARYLYGKTHGDFLPGQTHEKSS